MLRMEVSADSDSLEQLHSQHSWIPGKDSIRPSEASKAVKLQALLEVEAKWLAFEDFLLVTLFQRPKAKTKAGLLYCADGLVTAADRAFLPNEYPYDGLSSAHWILWFGCKQRPCDSTSISACISSAAAAGRNGVLRLRMVREPEDDGARAIPRACLLDRMVTLVVGLQH